MISHQQGVIVMTASRGLREVAVRSCRATRVILAKARPRQVGQLPAARLAKAGTGGQCWLVIPLLLLPLVLSVGCGNGKTVGAKSTELMQAVDPTQLQSQLRHHLDRHLAEWLGTASEIAANTKDRLVRENCLRLKMRSHDVYLTVLSKEDPRAAFLHAWITIADLRQHLMAGTDKPMFGEGQTKALALAQRMEAELIELGKTHFPPEAIEAARDEIEEAARRFARRTPFGTQSAYVPAQEDDVKTILRLPLLPVSVLEGASSTPKAIDRFTDTARDFAAVVQHLPEYSRWQMELLLLEAESSGPVGVMVQKLDDMEKAFRDAADVMGSMPKEVRVEFEKSLEAVEKTHSQIKETVADVRASVEQAKETAETVSRAMREFEASAQTAGKAADQFTRSAKAFEVAAVEVRGLLADYEKMGADEDPNAPPSAGADDYRAMADSITEAASEVRVLLAELQQPSATETSLGQAAREFRGLVDYTFWRVVALLVIIFVFALGYRWMGRRRPAAIG